MNKLFYLPLLLLVMSAPSAHVPADVSPQDAVLAVSTQEAATVEQLKEAFAELQNAEEAFLKGEIDADALSLIKRQYEELQDNLEAAQGCPTL